MNAMMRATCRLIWVIAVIRVAFGPGVANAQCPGLPDTNSGIGGDNSLPAEEAGGISWTVQIFRPVDPNDITGPPGYDTLRWVARSEVMPYMIRFENDPVFATASAVRVVILCPIHENLDLLQFRLGNFGFNGRLFEVPPNSATYSVRLDLITEQGIFVDVTAGINIVTRQAFWIFESIDPVTGLLVTDVDRGFLPVKDTTFVPENDTLGLGIPGDGFVNFTIRPAGYAQTRDTVAAFASIVFDDEQAIMTNVEVHTIDAVPPTSAISALPDISETTEVLLQLNAEDDPQGCGVRSKDIYISSNDEPYVLYASGVTDAYLTFSGVPGSNYRFYSRARDHVLNLEQKSTADAETTISTAPCEPECAGVRVAARVILDGPYVSSTGLMRDALRAGGLLPLQEPYTALGYAHVGGGGETTTGTVLGTTGNNAIVDWVLVELRSAANLATRVATRSALLQRDGDVVATDGTSPLTFHVPAGSYHVAIRHRNHLGVMTLNPVALGSIPATVDFTSAATATFGTNARKSITGTFPAQALWAGDVVFNGNIQYTGAGNDRDPILQRIGGTIPTNVVPGYLNEDVNLDGRVKYTGEANDRDPILQNIGGIVPTAIKDGTLP